jgi:uncharacterized membrane protein
MNPWETVIEVSFWLGQVYSAHFPSERKLMACNAVGNFGPRAVTLQCTLRMWAFPQTKVLRFHTMRGAGPASARKARALKQIQADRYV